MKTLVVGANGQIGRHVTQLLKEAGNHEAVAMIRSEEQKDYFESKGIQTTVADLLDSVESLKQTVEGFDAIIFTAGSGPKTGADMTLRVDLDGATKMIKAAEVAGVNRFLMVSAFQANNRENWNEKIAHYYVAKHFADEELKRSKLAYTIVKPGGLINDPGTAKIKIGSKDIIERGTVSREDVARVLVACLDKKSTEYKSFDLISGDQGVEDALDQL
ncbi:SDR family oxidoreductase [Allobacillus sp. GCM10007491]|uniref:SDR family oxidoreductase n=1 Tax=Allobacillus saliphilus TaxID=2912308 RepID=A0A941CU22_9BACI|nr:SDR family oxidoreductase [Allobacillus saliphilus]MBR7553952.1 SDR family oxidoreductase [Allobacillus saliphilus]